MNQIHLRTATVVAAAAYGLGAVLELVRDQPSTFTNPVDYLIEAFFVVGLAATVAVLAGLARTQPAIGSRIALAAAGVGNGAVLVAATATLVLGREALDLVFVLGVLVVIVGYLVCAVLDLFRRLTPRLVGVVLLLGFVGSMVVSGVLGALLGHGGDGGTAGGLALAAAWVATGRLLAPSGAEAAEPAEPVHA